jgi:sensor histidine kinase YesM
MDFTNQLFIPGYKDQDTVGTVTYIARDVLNLAIFAGGATSLALARRWFTADQKLKEAEAAHATAELRNLRSQINPHFLLNTLNNIYALTAFDTPKAQEAIQELSKMLRHILYDYQQTTVSLADEIEFLQNYVNLMRIRLQQSVDVQFNISTLNTSVEIAPLLFISLVENAFKHGVSPSEPSFIHIHIESDEHKVVCDIQNSNHPKTADDNSGHGIGLRNVQRRLDLYYPDHYEWVHGPTADGTVFQSRITIIFKD